MTTCAVVALSAASGAVAVPATAAAPKPNPVTTLINTLQTEIDNTVNNYELQYELGELEYFIKMDCAVNIVLALIGDWYGPLCPG